MNSILKYFVWFKYSKINLIKTLWLNFNYFPFLKAIHLPILIFGKCTLILGRNSKIIIDTLKYKTGMIKIGLSDPVRSIHNQSFLSIYGTCKFKQNVCIRRGIRLEIDSKSELVLNENVFISDCCTIISKKRIEIGKNSIIGNNVNISDTDFHYFMDLENKIIKSDRKDILLGEYNWIGSWCFIKKGTLTPNYWSLAGPFSMADRDYRSQIPPYSLMAGIPCKLIKNNYTFIFNKCKETQFSKHFEYNDNPITIDDSYKNYIENGNT